MRNDGIERRNGKKWNEISSEKSFPTQKTEKETHIATEKYRRKGAEKATENYSRKKGWDFFENSS